MGTPQGSTASPWFWNAIADQLHNKMDDLNGVDSEGFADDTCFVAIGKNINRIAKRMQKALDIAMAWAKAHKLEFSASKTKLILFTNKRKVETPPVIKLGGEVLKFTDRVKHLGVWVDSKLSFRYHLSEKIKEAKGVISRLKSSMGKIWGLKPSMALWIYKMVARPILGYASLVWSKITFTTKVRDELKKFQAFALNQMGYFRKNTPANALEVITHTMPLDIFLIYDSLCSYIRTRGHEKYSEEEMHTLQPKLKGHRQVIKETAVELGCDHLLKEELDDMTACFNWNKKYTVDSYSYDYSNKKRGIPILETDCNLYSDGSRFGNYRCGAGLSVWKVHNLYGQKVERPIEGHDRYSFYLEDQTIFACENFGVLSAANWLVDYHKIYGLKSAIINVDSLACLKGLASIKLKSKIVHKTVQALNNAAKFLPGGLTLRWVKAHVDGSDQHRGNAFADASAKEGAEGEGLLDPLDIPLRGMSTIKSEISGYLLKFWQVRWKQNPYKESPALATKLWFPIVNSKKSFNLLNKRSRSDYSIIVQAITGFNHLAYHECKVNQLAERGPNCSICRRPLRMTSEHIFNECEAFATLRLRIFGHHSPAIETISVPQLTRFLKEATIGWLPTENV